MDFVAFTPAGHNNTYLFYTLGGAGVLVEADPIYLSHYRKIRPRDLVDSVPGVPPRLQKNRTITYQRMADKGWSTASPGHAALACTLGNINGKVKFIMVPFFTNNELPCPQFNDGNFDTLSLDVKGLDRETPKGLDISLFYQKIMVFEDACNSLTQSVGPGFRISITNLSHRHLSIQYIISWKRPCFQGLDHFDKDLGDSKSFAEVDTRQL